jgi:hypothetical protein
VNVILVLQEDAQVRLPVIATVERALVNADRIATALIIVTVIVVLQQNVIVIVTSSGIVIAHLFGIAIVIANATKHVGPTVRIVSVAEVMLVIAIVGATGATIAVLANVLPVGMMVDTHGEINRDNNEQF